MIQITSTLQTPISVIVPQHFKIQCITRHLLMNSDEFYSGDKDDIFHVNSFQKVSITLQQKKQVYLETV